MRCWIEGAVNDMPELFPEAIADVFRIQERYAHGASVAGYLARYLAGGPLPDRRLESADSTSVCFRYRDHRDGSERLMRLSVHDFLSRWFEHVPPRGLRMIRRAGLYANSSHARRETVRQQLQERHSPETTAADDTVSQIRSLDPEYCPRCNTEVRVIPPEVLVLRSPVTTGCPTPQRIVTAGCVFRPP
ncbi:MAG: transposase [Planctomycetaceae bacterium]|nr:transposase [Planctomycetaceae bacterium]